MDLSGTTVSTATNNNGNALDAAAAQFVLNTREREHEEKQAKEARQAARAMYNRLYLEITRSSLNATDKGDLLAALNSDFGGGNTMPSAAQIAAIQTQMNKAIQKETQEKEDNAKKVAQYNAAVAAEVSRERAADRSKRSIVNTIRSAVGLERTEDHDDADEPSARRRTSRAANEENYVGRGSSRRRRKVEGNGLDRTAVNALATVIGEVNADEAVSTTITGANIVADGAEAVWRGDRRAIERESRNWGYGWRNNARDMLNSVGLGSVVGSDAVEGTAQAIGSTARTAASTAGNAITTARETAASVGSSIYRNTIGRFTGDDDAPEPRRAAPQRPRSPDTPELAPRRVAPQRPSEQEIARARRAANVDGSDTLTRAEVQDAIRRAGKTIAQADTNRDGIIGGDELAIATGFARSAAARPRGRQNSTN